MRRAASEEAHLLEPGDAANEARPLTDLAAEMDASSPDAPKALKVRPTSLPRICDYPSPCPPARTAT